eukprot:TRINITY_DN4163_c0_g1_i1.p1 TRINITY_DN4163_c0_g1~~TRINITY_DN4163_c0_g1_i1.p1  ORF type:complete len:313 (-),score=100.02 TRINITY_DN4163_c0_g1_i1:183-1121(-)
MKILLSGSSGLIGSRLNPYLTNKGHTIHRLVRKPTGNAKDVVWNPDQGTIDQENLKNVSPDVVIHLAGENIAGLTGWTESKKKAILESRTKGTGLLVKAILENERKPSLFISASGINHYGFDTKGQIATESTPQPTDPADRGFLGEVSDKWEAPTHELAKRDIRTVNIRTSIVLDPKGGTLGMMLLPFKLGLGGVVGSGKQYMPWVSIDDYKRAIDFIIEKKEVSGPVNLVSGPDTTNYDYTKALGKALNRPTICSIPSFAMTMQPNFISQFCRETLLADMRAESKKLKDLGFAFQDTNIYDTLDRLINKSS